jgi:hypothetical protein
MECLHVHQIFRGMKVIYISHTLYICVFFYICVYISIYVYMCVYIYIHICIHICVCIYIYILNVILYNIFSATVPWSQVWNFTLVMPCWCSNSLGLGMLACIVKTCGLEGPRRPWWHWWHFKQWLERKRLGFPKAHNGTSMNFLVHVNLYNQTTLKENS